AVQRFRLGACDMKSNARILFRYPINDVGDEARGDKRITSDSDLASRRIGKEFDILHTLAQVVENSHAAIEQRPPVLCWDNCLAVTVEETHTERLFQLGD